MGFSIDIDRKLSDLEESSVHDEAELKKLKDERLKSEENTMTFSSAPKRIYCSPAEIEAMREKASFSFVNDYGEDSDYFLSQEERKVKYKNYEYLKKVRGNKKRYNNVKNYIIACRNSYNYLQHLADSVPRLMMSKEEWLQLFYKGEIIVYEANFPKLSARIKKKINTDWLARCIVDPNYDVSKVDEDLKPAKDESDVLHMHIDDSLVEEVLEESKSIPEYNPLFCSEADALDPNINVIDSITRKEIKQWKKVPEFLVMESELKRLDQINSMNKPHNELDAVSMFQYELGKIDDKFTSSMRNKDPYPEMKGSIFNADDVYNYEAECIAWEKRNTYVDYNGRRISIDQREQDQIFQLMEESFDMRKFATNAYGSETENILDEATTRLKQAITIWTTEENAYKRKLKHHQISSTEATAFQIQRADHEFSKEYYQYIIDHKGKTPSRKKQGRMMKKHGIRRMPSGIRDFKQVHSAVNISDLYK